MSIERSKAGSPEIPLFPAAMRLPAAFPVFLAGIAIGLGHLPLSLQISVTLSYHDSLVRSLLLFLYPFGLAFLGVGAALEPRLARRFPRAGSSAWLRAAGASLLLFLAAAMRVNFFVASTAGLAAPALAHLLPLAAWFLCLGAVLAGVLREARERGSRSVGYAWALHLTGLLAGYGAADPLIYAVGVNAILFSIGASLLACSRAGWLALPVLLALASAAGLDGRIEGLRDTGVLAAGRAGRLKGGGRQTKRLPFAEGEPGFFGWSRFAQVRVYSKRLGDAVEHSAYYSFYLQWRTLVSERLGTLARGRQRLAPVYSEIAPSERAVLIGVGGGRTLGALDFPLHKGVTVVELDDAVVGLLRDEHPELNGGVFREVDAVARDGRFVVETSTVPYDVVVVESARYHAANTSYPVGTPQTLYTREAVRGYVSKLRAGGLLLLTFWGLDGSPEKEYLPLQVLAALAEEKMPHRSFALEAKGRYVVAVAASRDGRRLERIAERLAGSGSPASVRWRPRTAADERHRSALTDRSPFSRWHVLGRASKGCLLAAAGGFCLVTLMGALFARPRAAGPRSWPVVPYFYLIGAGHVSLLVATVYAYRSYWGDPVTTAVRLVLHFLVYGTLGSLLADRLVRRAPARSVALGVCAGVLAWHAACLHGIPFQSPSALGRELYAAAVLLPPAGRDAGGRR